MHPFTPSYYVRRHSALKCAVTWSLLLFMGFCNFAFGNQKLIVISSSEASVYQQAVRAFEQGVAQSDFLSTYSLSYFQLDALKKNNKIASAAEGDAIITIGSAAADYASRHFTGIPILCGFITRNAFSAITSKNPGNPTISAVFIDQSFNRLLNLASLLREDQSPFKIGLLSQSTQAIKNLSNQANHSDKDMLVELATLQAGNNPMNVIKPLMQASDIFIVRPNTSLFNRLVAKLVLQLSMRYRTPVIGFSKNYAQAGALLSLYASPEDIGADTAKNLEQWLAAPGKETPEASEGKTFSIVVNPHIAAKMSVQLAPEKLKVDLRRMEEKSF